MMKRIFALLLAAVMLFTLTACQDTPQEETETKPAIPMTVVHIEVPEWEDYDWEQKNRLTARFADDKTVIPLSLGCDGNLFATVPEEDAQRPIEAFFLEAVEAFPDDTDSRWEFYTMRDSVALGLMSTDEEGYALPFAPVTEADALQAVLRLFGVKPESEALSEYAKNALNILEGALPDYNGGQVITRQRLLTLCAAAMDRAGLVRLQEATAEEVNENFYISDADSIQNYALSAYMTLGLCGMMDSVETEEVDSEGWPVWKNFCRPEKEVQRYELAQILNMLRSEYQVYPSQMAMEYGFDKTMPVIDGSTSTLPFTQAVYQKLFSNGWRHIQKPLKHSKSHASYQRLINGEVDMIFASVYPASDILEMAEKAGVELELIPIAYDAMVFFTNSANSIDGLTIQQITDIYVDDAYDNWSQVGGPDALLYPWCRNNDSGSHAQMERHFLGDNPIHENVATETSFTMSDILTDVIGAKTDDPVGYAMGYSIYYYYHNMDMFYGTLSELKLLEIDGVAPTDETIANGTYPLSNNTYIALRKDAPKDAPARQMAEFMLTAAGQECVVNAGFGPLTPVE